MIYSPFSQIKLMIVLNHLCNDIIHVCHMNHQQIPSSSSGNRATMGSLTDHWWCLINFLQHVIICIMRLISTKIVGFLRHIRILPQFMRQLVAYFILHYWGELPYNLLLLHIFIFKTRRQESNYTIYTCMDSNTTRTVVGAILFI